MRILLTILLLAGIFVFLVVLFLAQEHRAEGPMSGEEVVPAQVEEPADPAPEPEGDASLLRLQDTFTHEAMGTDFSFTIYTKPGAESTSDIRMIAEEAFLEIDELEEIISRWRTDSQTSYVNANAAREPIKVGMYMLDLLDFSKEVYSESAGAFDVTVGPLIQAWGFYKGEGRLPTDEDLRNALAHVGLDKVKVDQEERTISFTQEGVMLDFGAVGKGLALDFAAKVLRRYGVTSAVLHGGTSTVVAIGAPPGEGGWTIRIRDPYNKDRHIGEVLLEDESFSTSGSYEKFFELEGRKYCHIFDPKTGRPVEGMLSASSIAPTGMMSDALSTAFFVLGEEETRNYCGSHPEVRAVLAPDPGDEALALGWINFPEQEE